MKRAREACLFISIVCFGIICGAFLATAHIYYWGLSPQGFALWMSVFGYVIKIGQTP
jgi:hypothetical protein